MIQTKPQKEVVKKYLSKKEEGLFPFTDTTLTIFSVCLHTTEQSIFPLAYFFSYFFSFICLIMYYNSYENGGFHTLGFPTFIHSFYNTYEKGGSGSPGPPSPPPDP